MSGALVRYDVPDGFDYLVEPYVDGGYVARDAHLAAITSLKREHEQQLAALQADAERYRWLRDQFELRIEESIIPREVSSKGNRVTYEHVRNRWCIWELQEDWRFGQTVEGDGEPLSFDAAIDAARAGTP
jgi:hypothetical protein